MQAKNFLSLLHKQFCRQNTIQAPGKKSQAIKFIIWGIFIILFHHEKSIPKPFQKASCKMPDCAVSRLVYLTFYAKKAVRNIS